MAPGERLVRLGLMILDFGRGREINLQPEVRTRTEFNTPAVLTEGGFDDSAGGTILPPL